MTSAVITRPAGAGDCCQAAAPPAAVKEALVISVVRVLFEASQSGQLCKGPMVPANRSTFIATTAQLLLTLGSNSSSAGPVKGFAKGMAALCKLLTACSTSTEQMLGVWRALVRCKQGPVANQGRALTQWPLTCDSGFRHGISCKARSAAQSYTPRLPVS